MDRKLPSSPEMAATVQRMRRVLTRPAMTRLDRKYAADAHVRQLEARLDLLERLRVPPDSELQRVSELASLLSPVGNAHRCERFGESGDGGYVLATDLPSPAGVISVGVGDEHSADIALAGRGIPVHEFDHTLPGVPSAVGAVNGITFHAFGLGSQIDERPLMALDEMCRVAGLGGSNNLWLLIDCEGAEWVALGERQDLTGFSQISIELHDLELVAFEQDGFLEAVRWLTRSHVPIALHANNYGPVFRLGGRLVPQAVELTLVRKDLFKSGLNRNPLHLMTPNASSRDEIDLSSFLDRAKS